jgi:hypothetical protein
MTIAVMGQYRSGRLVAATHHRTGFSGKTTVYGWSGSKCIAKPIFPRSHIHILPTHILPVPPSLLSFSFTFLPPSLFIFLHIFCHALKIKLLSVPEARVFISDH